MLHSTKASKKTIIDSQQVFSTERTPIRAETDVNFKKSNLKISL